MENETGTLLFNLLITAIGVALAAGAIVIRLRLEKEIKPDRSVVLGNWLPYWNSDDFTAAGNSYRKKYNLCYYALILFSILLFVYVRSGA